MKIQKVIIGGLYEHVINYEESQFVENYIINSNGDKQVEMLRFPYSYFYIANGCKEEEANLYFIENMQLYGASLSITFRQRRQGVGGQGYINENIKEISGVTWVNNRRERYLKIMAKGDKPIKSRKYTVNFCISGPDEEYKHTINIYIAPKENVHDVMLDFGSEATQMIIEKRSSDISQQSNVSLFNEMFILSNKQNNQAQSNLVGSEEEYIQHDEGSNNLYKSRFYVTRKISNEINDIKGYQQQLRYMIKLEQNGSEDLKKNLMLVPNQKLYSWGGIQFEQVEYKNNSTHLNQVGEPGLLYQSCVDYFIKIAVGKIKDYKNSFISLHVMMPNVYKPKEVSEKLRQLYAVVNYEIGKEENENIKGFEVTAVSESDASLIGIMANEQQNKQAWRDGLYLMIDAGHGTLDLSLSKTKIVHQNDQTFPEIKTYWRGSIIGSGQYMSYLILLDVLATLGLKEDEIKTYLRNILSSKDEYQKNKLMSYIDTIKKHYKEKSQMKIWQTLENTDTENIESIINVIGRQHKSEENDKSIKLSNEYFKSGIKKYIDHFVEKFVEVIPILSDIQANENPILKYILNMPKLNIVFSGRASLFEPFKEEIIKAIQDVYYRNGYIEHKDKKSLRNRFNLLLYNPRKWLYEKIRTIETLEYKHETVAADEKNIPLLSLDMIRKGKVHRRMLLENRELGLQIDDTNTTNNSRKKRTPKKTPNATKFANNNQQKVDSNQEDYTDIN